MKDEEINRAIAEACGWTNIRMHFNDTLQCEWLMGCPPNPHVEVAVPNYCKDLNAMHEAEKVFDKDGTMNYQKELVRIAVNPNIVNKGKPWVEGFLFHATARQRAEAFLKTVGKWREEGEGV